jgi:hypothetical protein
MPAMRIRRLASQSGIEVSQLRLGRLVAEEQKGRLDNLPDGDLLQMLIPENPEQMRLDDQEMAQIKATQANYPPIQSSQPDDPNQQ